MDPESEAVLGCVGVPLLLGFAFWAFWPSSGERREWREGTDKAFAEALAQQQVSQSLRDPASAQFSDGQASSKLPNVHCGRVNATNAFGGRSGPQRYITTSSVTFLEEALPTGEMDRLWASMC
jgi:hypothetical protein